MNDSGEDILKVVREIRSLLRPISVCFEEQAREIQRQRSEEKLKELEGLLTPVRRRIYPLLFDSRRLSQMEIGEEANTTQPTVSRFIDALSECGLIAQTKNDMGILVYKDTFGLRRLMEERNERERQPAD